MAKKKKSAKRAAKRTVKKVVKPAVKAARANQQAWTQQSAKLYQLPFAQADVSEATKQATAAAQSATENFVRMSNDAMQQWWNVAQSATSAEGVANATKAKVNDLFSHSLPNFNAAEAQEKFANFSRESAEQFTRSAGNYGKAFNEAMELSRENAETVVEVTNIAVALTKELGAELIGYANRNFSHNVELSKQVLACRTLNDMFDLSSRFMKTNLDSFFSESVKLSELLFQASTDVSEPLNERISESSDRISKVLAA